MSGAISREQQFLINFGGIIMVLIVGVVVYQMFTGGGDVMLADMSPQRPVVQVTRPGGEGLEVNKDAGSQPKSWLDSKQPARIFSPPAQNPAPQKVEPPADQVRSIKAPAELQASWNGQPLKPLRQDEMNLSPTKTPAGTQSVSVMEGGRATGAQMPKNKPEPVVPAPPAFKPAPLSVAPRKVRLSAPQAPVPVPSRQVTQIRRPAPTQAVRNQAPAQVQPPRRAPIQPAYTMPPQVAKTPSLPSMRPIQPNRAPAQTFRIPPQNVAPAAPRGGYSVQVSSFSDNMRASGLRQRLGSLPFNGQNLPVHVTTAAVKGKTYYRVRLGPFPNREVANQARLYLQQRTGQSGQIVAPGR
ncbi:SPOR domain-containing protein [Magnetococcus sp. PR-3]|uniref:SPOR domain-containing protein n=1 Tax=Magnetococcus sp. PR-3 TaxID=3120355 RepID=UPI002FCDFF6E